MSGIYRLDRMTQAAIADAMEREEDALLRWHEAMVDEESLSGDWDIENPEPGLYKALSDWGTADRVMDAIDIVARRDGYTRLVSDTCSQIDSDGTVIITAEYQQEDAA